jgi:DNA-binding XRE family transcriptional regulator
MDSIEALIQIAIKRRKELGVTQTELARQMGVRNATICDMENGKTRSTLAIDVIRHLGGVLIVDWYN